MSTTKTNKPDENRVKEEIGKLKALKPQLRRRSMFGDDNHAIIDAQIATLEEGLTEDQIYDRWDNEDEDTANLISNALSAREWMETGQADGETDLVSAWEPLTHRA